MVVLNDLKFSKVSALQQWPWFSKRNLGKATPRAFDRYFVITTT